MSENKKRKKQYFRPGKRGRWQHRLEPGIRGFLLTCNMREKEAVREAYNILNQYADDLYGTEKVSDEADNSDSSEEDDEDVDDLEAAVQKEVASLKKQKSTASRFQVVDSGAKNCVFIRTTLEDPDSIAHKIFSDVYESQRAIARFVLRMLPVVGTCHADEEALRKLAEDTLPRYFTSDEPHSYCIEVKVRNNNSIGRSQILPLLGDVVETLNPKNNVEFSKPDFMIIADVLKTVLCLSVVRDFFKFRKYNIVEVAKIKKAAEAKNSEGPKSAEANPEEKHVDEDGDAVGVTVGIEGRSVTPPGAGECCEADASSGKDTQQEQSEVCDDVSAPGPGNA